MPRAALYMRVSTLDQHPETQLYDLRELARQRGFQIAQEYTDRLSGAKARRPGLDQMLKDARPRQFDVVLVWAGDRIARSVRHFLEVLDELNHLGIEFVSRSGRTSTRAARWAAPSSSSSALSPNWNATLLSNASGPGCAAQNWKAAASAAPRSTSTARPFSATVAAA